MIRKWPCFLGLCLLALPTSLMNAQETSLAGTLQGPDGSPVPGAIVYVLDSTGATVRGVLTDGQGRFHVSLGSPGEYRLRIERIGFETEEVPCPVVGPEGEHRIITLRVRPVELDPIRVTTDRVCRREANRNPELLRIWSEALKALAQTELSVEEGSRDFRVEVSERVLGRDLELLRARADTLSLSGEHGFNFQPMEQLGAKGWGERVGDSITTLYGPSPDAFLSPWFGATHCFSLAKGSHLRGWIGVSFESIPDSLQVGMQGTFWLDPASWRLQEIDFRYAGTPELEEARHQGGKLILQGGADGEWYASAWSVLGPVLEPAGYRYTPLGGNVYQRQQDYRVSGYVEHAGRMLVPYEVPATATSPWATHDALAAALPNPDTQKAALIGEAIRAACPGLKEGVIPAVVAGTVTDSASGVPLADVRVRVTRQGESGVGALPLETRTDARGYYQFCDAPPGTDLVMEASLGPATARATILIEGGSLDIEHLQLPFSDPERPGTILGRVIDAETRRPVDNASVTLDEVQGAHTLTNQFGYFSLGKQPWGIYQLSVSALGYADRHTALRVQGGLSQTVEIALAADPIPIEGLEVVVQAQDPGGLLDDMLRRMRLGFGSFVTRDVIERRPTARVADLLREVPGVQVAIRGPEEVYLVVRNRQCTPRVLVDGVPWENAAATALMSFVAEDVEAIEVYRGFLETPGEFMGNGPPPCAVVVIWTRWASSVRR